MLSLSSEDVETWKFFEGGNFSVNKNNVPFCAIGVDHAMEQENKSIKIAGGITGITLNQTALDRFVLTAPQISQIVEEVIESNGINDTWIRNTISSLVLQIDVSQKKQKV